MGVFLITSFVYLSTIEQTVSFGIAENIFSAYKLRSPSSWLVSIIWRIFSLFATRTSEVVIINIMSALCSSLQFIFILVVTAFGRKVFSIKEDTNIEAGKMIAILGSGVIGS